jgi:hypothetical protein
MTLRFSALRSAGEACEYVEALIVIARIFACG